jgi:predicted acylesterase/phospholipase RssA
VLSGGGANGAYEVGVLKGLARGLSPSTAQQPLAPSVLAATSIGSFNSAVLLSNLADSWSRATDALEKVWLERISLSGRASGNGVFRVRANPLSWIDVDALRNDPLKPRAIWPATPCSWRRTGPRARASSRRRRAASSVGPPNWSI